jgi:hypothetical protein
LLLARMAATPATVSPMIAKKVLRVRFMIFLPCEKIGFCRSAD